MAGPAAAAAGSNMATGSAASGAASTAINAGGNLVGTLAGLGYNIWSQLHQNDWNANQMQLQNQWNIDQWNRENAYNTPLAQMQRLAAAGINPALAYSNGQLMNEAAGSPAMQASQGRAPIVDPLSMAQASLMFSQARLADSQSRKVDEETQYQQYLNQVEKELQRIPIGHVVTYSDNGEETYEVVYGNARVKIAERELQALGLENQGLEYQLGDIYYNLAVLTGSDMVPGPDVLPSSLPNYNSASAALRGDQNVRTVSGRLANVAEEAAEAEKAGREAYAKWLEEHKDDPVVKFALTVQGFLQTFGISLPSFGGARSSGSSNSEGNRAGYNSTSMRSSRSWFFRAR